MGGPVGHYATPLDVSVDALSDVLDLIHLRGETLTVDRVVGGTDVRHVSNERLLHIVEQGPVELIVGEGQRVRLGQGDMALLATGAAHRLTSAVDVGWMSGRFLVEENAAAPLLAELPDVIVLRGAEAGLEWLPLRACS